MNLDNRSSKSVCKFESLKKNFSETNSRNRSPITYYISDRITGQAIPRAFRIESENSHKGTRTGTPLEAPRNSEANKTFQCTSNPDNSCQRCKKLEIDINLLKSYSNKSVEKSSVTDKHLKQYESLLKIKDNRLKEKEAALSSQMEYIEKEKLKLAQDRKDFEERVPEGKIGPNQIVINRLVLPEKKFEKLPERIVNFSFEESYKDYAKGSRLSVSDYERSERSFEMGLKQAERKLENAEAEVGRLNEEIVQLKGKHQSKIACLNSEMEQLKEKYLSELRSVSYKVETNRNMIAAKETEITELQKQLELERKRYAEELRLIDELKGILTAQRENFDKEKLHLEASQQQIINEYEELKASFKAKTYNSESPGKSITVQNANSTLLYIYKEIEGSSQPFEISLVTNPIYNKEFDFSLVINPDKSSESIDMSGFNFEYSPNKSTYVSSDDSLFRFPKSELSEKVRDHKIILLEEEHKLKENSLKKDIQTAMSRIKLLEKSNEDLSSQLASALTENQKLADSQNKHKEKIKTLKTVRKKYIQRISTSREISSSSLEDLSNELKVQELTVLLEQKFQTLLERNNRIDLFESELIQQEKSIVKDAECLKLLHDDLQAEKTRFSEEKEKFSDQKLALLEIEKKLTEKDQLLSIKENELFKLKSELIDRENIITQRLMGMQVRKFKRVNTFLSSPSMDSPLLR